MIENYNLFLLICGIAFLLGALFPILFKRTPVSLPMLQVTLGAIVGYFWITLDFLNPIENGVVIEKLTEIVVLVSLVGAGIKIDTELSWQLWRPTARLLLITMPIGIFAMAILGYYAFGLSLGAAILLGAVLAPTDPVLASSIQVGPPNTGGEDTPRFILTSEAGLNDGLAFPFVYLAIKTAEAFSEGDHFTSELLWSWFTHDVVWKIGAGLLVGIFVGKIMAKLVFSKYSKETTISQGYVVIALTLVAYGLAEFVHSYGFIAVFVAAFVFRRSERQHSYHQKLHDFAEQSEGLLMSLVLVTFGMFLGQGLQSGVELTWRVYIVSFTFLLLIRPLGGFIALTGLRLPHTEKYAISALGIRGIGTLYYLSYALNQGFFGEEDALKLWVVCSIVILASIFIHGLSAPRLLKMTPNKND
ncbi:MULTISPECIES: cation:proton antiporter [Psychrobacter]|jgi:sodium/hydrogen antiporter|uniref:Cation:proton antiporter n=1 Tax=Psychrobacter namhaensis TaxID=292734 RepID=A0ABW8LA89_9GAMM|nr:MULTISPECIES: cation:proton antiporter [Psychrobacter]MCD1279301.1 sodium:proton antiporter [Psychrobacter sp. CCUG 69069]HCN18305.1 sodium:proton antiporter [Psychrobacter sp.]|tara:strand:+ start:719 stop:1966 length:1248 start_codon:yes stop_codon:yes gene_type:complete